MGTTSGWVDEAVSAFGVASKAKLAGPGDREAAIRSPLEALLGAAGTALGVPAVFHDEVRDTERRVRPDYGVAVQGAITGYLEVKAPGRGVDPAGFTGHDKVQWERQRDLPNLVYTNGTEWRLYRDGDLLLGPVTLGGGTLDIAGSALATPVGFEELLTNFLRWKPAPITSVGALVRAVAPLTRLLRGEVLDQLSSERRAVKAGDDVASKPFLGLARDWRRLLFPAPTMADKTKADAAFADGYAQAISFALLLARTKNIDLSDTKLHEVGAELGDDHSLMGKALQLLTDGVAADFRVTLDLLVRVVGAVDWPKVRKGRRDTYLHLYESFLEAYDNELRKQSGSYYTPRDVVEEMVRLTEEVLTTQLGRTAGFRDPAVLTVDPAMGTGTYLHTILERVAEQTEAIDGPGAVAGAVTEVAERLVGFELQMGPYAVAELRAADLLASHQATIPPGGMKTYVTDTLDDPFAATVELGSGLQLIAASRTKANKVKASANVTVVIGNPPYRERAEGLGGWVESGTLANLHKGTTHPILEDFELEDNGRTEYVLKNLYVYFWRWATWKVWESTPQDADDGDAGVVCFITTAGYLRGPGFKGMRRYLRQHASAGWIIDLTPEGQTPDTRTRVFPGVRQPLAIGIFVRKPDGATTTPATIRYRAVHGKQAEKFAALQAVTLDGEGWRNARTAWTAPLTPAADTAWDEYPALNDLMPWTAPGVKPNRTWVYSPSRAVLGDRWAKLVNEDDEQRKSLLFRESDTSSVNALKDRLAGHLDLHDPLRGVGSETGSPQSPTRVAYRSFDRQWLIPDGRVIDRDRPPLWSARMPGQIYVVEQHSEPISEGPGLTFSTLVPDMHLFNGRGGRALPLLHPSGAPNLARGLLPALSAVATGADVLAYIAATVAHPGYTRRFADELTTPGIRVPLSADPDVFAEAVELGRQVVWLHTYGEAMSGSERPQGSVRYPAGDPRQPLSRKAITTMPLDVSYDAERAVLILGTGEFGPVAPAVWDYAVGGRNVIKSWVNYRKAVPGGKKTSPLDSMHVGSWESPWTTELVDLLTVLTRLVELEPAQADLLTRVLAGPLLSMAELTAAGVSWPTKAKDRAPRYSTTLAPTSQRSFDDAPEPDPEPPKS